MFMRRDASASPSSVTNLQQNPIRGPWVSTSKARPPDRLAAAGLEGSGHGSHPTARDQDFSDNATTTAPARLRPSSSSGGGRPSRTGKARRPRDASCTGRSRVMCSPSSTPIASKRITSPVRRCAAILGSAEITLAILQDPRVVWDAPTMGRTCRSLAPERSPTRYRRNDVEPPNTLSWQLDLVPVQGWLLQRANDRGLLEGLRNERGAAQARGKLAGAGCRDEGKRNVPLEQGGRDFVALAVGHVDVEQREVEAAAEVPTCLGESTEHPHDLMSFSYHDGFQVHCDAGIVLQNENPHGKRSNNSPRATLRTSTGLHCRRERSGMQH